MWTFEQSLAALGKPISCVAMDDWAGRKLIVGRWRHGDIELRRSAEDAIRVVMSLGGTYHVRHAQPGFSAEIDSAVGDIKVFPPLGAWEIAIEGTFDVVQIFIEADGVRRDVLGLAQAQAKPLFNVANEDLRACALSLFLASPTRTEARTHVAAAMLRSVLRQVLRPGGGRGPVGGLQAAMLHRIDVAIDAQLTDPLAPKPSIGDLAAVAGLSVDHFIRAFRRATGTTPYQYLMARRRQRAMALLGLPRLSIAEVADALAFSSPAHFVAAFRQRFGTTPGRYRRAVLDIGA